MSSVHRINTQIGPKMTSLSQYAARSPRLTNLYKKLIKPIYFKEEIIILESRINKSSSKLPKDIIFTLANGDPYFYKSVKKSIPGKYRIFRDRIEQGIKCFVMYNTRGLLVSYVWISDKDYYEPRHNYTFKLNKGQIYQFDGYVNPDYRKGMVAFVFLKHSWTYFIDRGYTSALSIVDKDNIRAMKFHHFIGFRETGEELITHFIFRNPVTKIKRQNV